MKILNYFPAFKVLPSRDDRIRLEQRHTFQCRRQIYSSRDVAKKWTSRVLDP
jgi:hypothetical protein